MSEVSLRSWGQNGNEPHESDELVSKVERVLSLRTDRILLVLDKCTDNQNYLACLRTAEVLGRC